MELTDNMLERLKVHVPEEKWEEVEKIVESEMGMFNPIGQLEKGKINFISIYTGMMPMQKAEEYMRKVVKKIRTLLGENAKDYEIFYMAKTGQGYGNTISHAEKGKLTIVDIDTGRMPKEKADDYFDKHVKLFDEFKEKGYDLAFIKRDHNREPTVTTVTGEE